MIFYRIENRTNKPEIGKRKEERGKRIRKTTDILKRVKFENPDLQC
jgi:hypothetical protein